MQRCRMMSQKSSKVGTWTCSISYRKPQPPLSILYSQISTIERMQYNIQANLEENEVK